VEEFKVMVAKTEAELKQRWAEWEEVQKEIIQLGVDILGPEAFEQKAETPKSRSASCKAEIDELDLEHKTFLEKVRREIPSICIQALEKMEAAEKVGIPLRSTKYTKLSSNFILFRKLTYK
jgi:hypothetical protein